MVLLRRKRVKGTRIIRLIIISFSFISFLMRKVLAVASVGAEHKALVLKDLKSIFRRIKIPLDILLQEEKTTEHTSDHHTLFKSYPYITLTIPNYEQHREYLQKVYKNNVLFSKFILLISRGDTYEELIQQRNEEILREHARNWNNTVSCAFDSSPLFTDLEQQLTKVDKILGEMDIRGKISEIDAQKRFHLIQHWRKPQDDPHQPQDKDDPKKALLKLFFGLELVQGGRRGRRGAIGAGGIIIASDYRYNNSEEFVELEEETCEEECMQDTMGACMSKVVVVSGSVGGDESGAIIRGKKQVERRQAKRRSEKSLADVKRNPYLKKKYADEVIIGEPMVQE